MSAPLAAAAVVTAAAVRTVDNARRGVLVGVLVALAVVGGGLLYLGLTATQNHPITASTYTTTPQAKVQTSAAPSSSANAIGVIGAASGAASALIAAAGFVVSLRRSKPS